jgi:hydroxypyruvate isomerase
MSINQSVCLPILGQFNQIKLIKEVAEIGYTAVEIWGRDEKFEELCDHVQEYGLTIASMIGHQSLTDGLNNTNNHQRIEDELGQSIELAVKSGISGLICFSGNRITNLTEAQALENTVNGLLRVAPYAEKYGINLNLELLNSKIDHIGYQCDSTAWGLEVVRKVNSPRVKLLYDIYHMQIMEGDIIRTVGENINAIGHFHTAGNPGRHELDDNQELNYSAICSAISATDYKGFIGHEFRPKDNNIVRALKQAFITCSG